MSSPGSTPQPVQITNTQFLAATRPNRLKVSSGNNYADGGTTRSNLQQTGLLDRMVLYVACTVVVAGTVTGGTFNGFAQGNPAPWSILKQVTFGSNNGINMRTCSGWSLYKWVRKRYQTDPMKCTAVNYSTNTLAALGLNQGSSNIVAGANVAAGTYTFIVALPIDGAYNQTAERGLLSMQNGNIIYTLGIQWGQVSGGISATGGSNDLFNGLTGTGLSVTPTIQYYVAQDIWMVPVYDQTKYTMSYLQGEFVGLTDGIQTPLNTGNVLFKPPQNDLYTGIGLEYINNGAPMTPAQLQNPQWSYAGAVYPYVDDTYPFLVRNFFEGQIPDVDGNLWYDLGMRRGERLRRDTIDAFNDQTITNLSIQVTIPNTVTITGVNQINYVLETLTQFAQGPS